MCGVRRERENVKFLVVESIDKLRNFSVCQKVLAKHEHQLDSSYYITIICSGLSSS
jgi:hypothetical protein